MLIYRICFLSPCLYTCALIHVHAFDILRPCCVLSRIPNPSTCTPALVAWIDSHPSPSNDKQKARDHGTEGGPDPKLAAAQGSRFISFALSLRQMAISPLTFIFTDITLRSSSRKAKSLTSASLEPLLRDAVHEPFRGARVICSDHALAPPFRHGCSAATHSGASHLIPPDAAVKQRSPLFPPLILNFSSVASRKTGRAPRDFRPQERPGAIKSFGRCESKIFSFLFRFLSPSLRFLTFLFPRHVERLETAVCLAVYKTEWPILYSSIVYYLY